MINKRWRYISESQRRLFELVKFYFPDAELEFAIGGRINKKGFNRRWADIGIPSLKIDIEYDGWSHENMSFTDTERDRVLSLQGWKTVRFNKSNIDTATQILKQLKQSKW